MPIKDYWYFPNESSVPTELTAVTGGSGSVALNGSGAAKRLRITNGGTASSDYAMAYGTTALDKTKLYVIMAEVSMSGTAGAWVPKLVGLYDGSSAPAAATQSNFNTAMRFWQEYQMSSGADTADRIQLKFKNPSGTQYQYIAGTAPDYGTGSWSSTFTYTRTHFDEDSLYRFVIVYDGTQATPRARSMVFGSTETTYENGWMLNYDSTWRDFDTAATDIDPFDNDMWVIFGDAINDQSKNVITFDYRRIMVAELDETVEAEFLADNAGEASPRNNFPTDYEIFLYINPMPDACSMWIPRDIMTTNPIVTSGSDVWVKDPHIVEDGGTYYLFYNLRKASDSKSYIYVVSTTDILDGTWASATEISAPGSDNKHEFPWATRYSGTWYLVYGVETSTPTWRIEYKTTTASAPTSGWSSATTLYDAASEGGAWTSSGGSVPYLVWYSGTFTGGIWILTYAGYDGTDWQGGMAISTNGITGTYVDVVANPTWALEGASTLINGTMTDVTQITVDSTTGFVAGEHIWLRRASNAHEIISVDSGTTMTLHMETTVADNEEVESQAYRGVYSRVLRYINSTSWVSYGTAFKFPNNANVNEAGGEGAILFVGTGDVIDPLSDTFRAARVGDSQMDYTIPFLAQWAYSVENPGGAFTAFTAGVADSRTFLAYATGDVSIGASIENTAGNQTNVYSYFDNVISSPGTDGVRNDTSETTGTATFDITNMPSDFDSIDFLNIAYSVQASGFTDDTCTVTARITNSSGTALTDTLTIADETYTTKQQWAEPFTVNATGLAASKSDWDGARLELVWTYSKTAGPDNAQITVFAVELVGTYTVAVGGATGFMTTNTGYWGT